MSDPCVIPLVLEPQPEGGFTVTSPRIPELITEGDTEAEAVENAWDALQAVLHAFDYLGRPLPLGLPAVPDRDSVRFEYLIRA